MGINVGFQGRIGTDGRRVGAVSSKRPPHPGEDAPNVIIVLLDDTGLRPARLLRLRHRHARTSTPWRPMGCSSPTSTSRRCARRPGRRCSPAASNHAVGMRSIRTSSPASPTSWATSPTTRPPWPRCWATPATPRSPWASGTWRRWSSARPPARSTSGRSAAASTASTASSTARPTSSTPSWWPTTIPIDTPGTPEDGYHLSADLVDQALRMIADSKGVRPDRPFFTYLAFGATHAPHQAPPEYMAKYRGRYDEGWDVVRERWFRTPDRTRRHSRRHGAVAAQPGREAVGRAVGQRAAARGPAAGGVRRVPRSHRRADRSAGRRAAPARPAGQHDPGACTPTTAPRRRAARSA